MNPKKTGEILKDFILDMVIKSAITFEQDSEDFYRNSYEKVNDPESKNLLKSLISEEEGHVNKLRSLLGTDLNEVITSVDTNEIQLLDNNYIERQKRIDPQDDPKKIVKIAIEREIASFQFYSLLCQRTSMEKVKHLFAFLAKEEEIHRKRLEIELARLTK